MGVIIKTVAGRRYAYLAYRSGPKVVHKYLGRASSQHVAEMIRAAEGVRTVPGPFHALFWDVDPGSIDLRKNARFVIERILEHGDIAALRWIRSLYPDRAILETCETSRKISRKSKDFWRIWFRDSHAS